MKKIMREAYPISKNTWKAVSAPYNVEGAGNRQVVDYTIGQMTVGDEPPQGILEPIFKDIAEEIFNKTVKVHINLGADPQLVVEKNGKLVIHNADVPVLKQELDAILDVSTKNYNRIIALTEIRANMYSYAKLGNTTKILREQLTTALPEGVLLDNKPLNYDFLNLYLREKYRISDIPEEDTLKAIVRNYSKVELVNLYGGMLEFAENGVAKTSPMDKLLEKYQPNEIEEAFNDELQRRFFIGEIR